MKPITPDEQAAWCEWRDAERDLDGKFAAYEQARERRDIALAKMRRAAIGEQR